LKWGQGAKCIGGEIKVKTLERALELKKRGYIVTPDPTLEPIQKAYKDGAIKEFERHSRLGLFQKNRSGRRFSACVILVSSVLRSRPEHTLCVNWPWRSGIVPSRN